MSVSRSSLQQGVQILQFRYIFQDHVLRDVVRVPFLPNAPAGLKLTDVVVKPDQGTAELCAPNVSMPASTVSGHENQPLSPFIITHIREPTHLSMSSRRR